MKTKLLLSLCLVLGFVMGSHAQEPVGKERPPITVNVLGEVKKAARIILPNNGTILDALATVGDATSDGDLHRVQLLHKSATEKPEITKVNVSDILNGKAANVMLLDGDTVDVPKRLIAVKF